MSLYGKYIKERLGEEIFETEEGFATYKFFANGTTGEQCVYIKDIFVAKEARRKAIGTAITNAIVGLAVAKGVSVLYGSVSVNATGSTESMKALLAYGLELSHLDGELIYFKKEIGG